MKWSEDGSEVTMSRAEYDTLQEGYATVKCHCGSEVQVFRFSGPGDPAPCEVCGCYQRDAEAIVDCIVEKRKRYPFLKSVKAFIDGLKYNKVEAYVKNKVMREFNLGTDEEYTELRGALAFAVMYDGGEFNKV
jgi:hypothetical protein